MANISEKHISAINELMAELERECSEPTLMTAENSQQVTTKALVVNQAMGVVTFQEPNDWSGSVIGGYPPSIPMNQSGKVTHRGVPPNDTNGSIGAVIYDGPNVQGGPDCCAWLVAWSALGNDSDNKVYVEAGANTKYPPGSVDWDKIYESLKDSGNQSYCHDPVTGAEVVAQIDETGNTPRLAVVFDVAIQ